MNYLTTWFHAYIIHFSGWISLMFGTHFYNNGIEKFEDIKPLFKVAFITSAILSLFSSQAHTHYLTYFGGK